MNLRTRSSVLVIILLLCGNAIPQVSKQASSDASLGCASPAGSRGTKCQRNINASDAGGASTSLTCYLSRQSGFLMKHANIGKPLINYYPDDPRVAEALLGIGRSYFQGRYYPESYTACYDRLARNYPSTKEGREGLNFSAAALLRMGRTSEAADRYIEYINRFPDGERIETAHLNANRYFARGWTAYKMRDT